MNREHTLRWRITLLICMFIAVALVAAVGCVSHDYHHSTKGLATKVQKQETDPIREWFVTLEWSLLVAVNNAQNPILPDEDLIAAFRKHRATFEQLQQMIAADSALHRVDDDWTDPTTPKDAGVSPERMAQYRQLLTEVGCRRGFCAYPGRPGIYFISAAQGTVVSSLTKGYYYFEATPPLLVTNTSAYSPENGVDSYEVFRPIEGHWYVYFQRD
jgi:hypothetical protein